jgi:hypothetical protein
MAAEDARPRAESPEALLSAASSREGVRRALSGLPSCQRRTLEAAFFEGLSYSEIAEREAVPLGTVKSRAARALTSLRVALDTEPSQQAARGRSRARPNALKKRLAGPIEARDVAIRSTPDSSNKSTGVGAFPDA